jgi:hypothetical protein
MNVRITFSSVNVLTQDSNHFENCSWCLRATFIGFISVSSLYVHYIHIKAKIYDNNNENNTI